MNGPKKKRITCSVSFGSTIHDGTSCTIDMIIQMVSPGPWRYVLYHFICPQFLTPMIVQDLKDRYYSVCRKLVRNRPWAADEASKAQLISSFQFDKGTLHITPLVSPRRPTQTYTDREMTRKKYVVSLENRTPEQIAEEEALYIEIKRLEQNERKFKKERDELLRTLAGIDSGLPDIVEDDGGLLGLTADGKKRRKGAAAMDGDSPSTPSVISLNAPIIKRPQTAKSAAYGTIFLISFASSLL